MGEWRRNTFKYPHVRNVLSAIAAAAMLSVTGIIIALEDDQRIRRALAVVPSINFYRYQVSFKLLKV